MTHNLFDTLQEFKLASGAAGRFHSLPALEKAGVGRVSRLPVSIRIVLESVLRNCDGKKVNEVHVRQLANWNPTAARTDEIPFVVARVVLQDFTGDTSYHTETKSTYDPPAKGMPSGNSTVDGRWTGPCPAGMQPGDAVLPDGRKVNMRAMAGGPAGGAPAGAPAGAPPKKQPQ